MTSPEDIRRYRENWQDEVDSAAEYRAMAAGETDPRLAQVYTNLGRMEEAHTAFWEDKLARAGAAIGPRQPSWRSRILAWIAQRLGPDLVLATIAAREEADQNFYTTQPEASATRMPAQERCGTQRCSACSYARSRADSRRLPRPATRGATAQSAPTRYARRCSAPTTGCARI